MSISTKNLVRYSAIALGLIAFTSPSYAQTSATEFEFEPIEVQESNWSFSSEDETTSVQDNLEQLQEYSLSDTDDSDIRITDEQPRWSNRGDIEDFSIDTDVYEY